MSKALATKNVAAVALALAMIVGFAFAFATPAKADVLSDLQAQVQALLAQISSLQGGSGTTVGASCTTFTQNLKAGSTGSEVMALQKFLNGNGVQIAASGAGSPGNETSYFGGLTKAAVVKFQNKYASDILAPVGLTYGTGNWFASTRAKANALCVGGVVTPGPVIPGPVVTGNLNVGMASQPANSLAPEGAARVPFTNFTLTNNSGAAVTVNSVTVQKSGLGNKAAFDGIILVDDAGMQYGNAKTLNSNNVATLDAGFTLNPGQTKTFTVAGNMAASLDDYTGQVLSITVTGINTSATVSGSLPITGASHTLNSTLAIGAVAMAVGPTDPDTTAYNSATVGKAIGTTAFVFAAVKATNSGSAEDMWVKSVRWNQSGSAGSGDLGNVLTVVDGTSYPTTISSDGKYYTTIFPGNGLEIKKGLQKEFIVKADILGGPARTIAFDIYKAADIYVVGATYGYGITATQSESGTAGDGSEFTSGTPFFSATVVQVNAGTVSSVSRATEVAAQNIVEVSPSQPLGGFAVDIKGEAITVSGITFGFNLSDSSGNNEDASMIDNITLVDENGVIVAGPTDGVAAATVATSGKVAFTDSVTFPTGRHVYTLKGQLTSDFENGDTITASTTPNSTYWTNAKGAITGNAVTISNSDVTANTMTVRAGSVVASVSGTPAAATIVSGVSGLLVGNIALDATQSGEDVRFTTLKIYYTDSMSIDPTNCALWDGATRLTSTTVNPATSGDDTYTLDSMLTVTKGTVKTIGVKCDIPGSASSGDFSFGIDDTAGNTTFSGVGLTSSQTITPTTATAALAAGNTMTMTGNGTLTVTLDASSPSYAVAAGGTSNVTLGVLRFSGVNEAMRLDRVSLEMTGVDATSSPGNISQVTLWDGATQVGTAIFAGTRHATSTISTTVNSGAGVVIPANGYKNLVVKGDLAAIGTSQAGKQGALIQVDYDGADTTGTRAIGLSSGATVNHSSTADTAVSGVRTFRSYPTIAKLAVPTTVLTTGSNVDLYRFSITANASGDVGLYQLTVNIATSTYSAANGTTSVTGLKLYGFTDASFSSGISGFTSGLLSDGAVATQVLDGDNAMTIDQSSLDKVTIPAGTTYYFKVIGTVAQNAGTTASVGSVTTRISGDSAYPVINDVGNLMQQAATASTGSTSDAENDFIWSPNATTTSATSNHDWTNGYGIAGLPAAGTDTVTLSK